MYCSSIGSRRRERSSLKLGRLTIRTGFSASDFNHALKQSQLTFYCITLADLQALVTVAGKVGGGEGGNDARSQRMTLERFQTFDIPNTRLCASERSQRYSDQ